MIEPRRPHFNPKKNKEERSLGYHRNRTWERHSSRWRCKTKSSSWFSSMSLGSPLLMFYISLTVNIFIYGSMCRITMSFNFIIPILIGLVLLVRGKDQSPFVTHPSNMWIFMISTFIYYSVTQRSMPLAARISGSLISILLLCFFIPRWLGLVLLIVWIFVTINVAYKLHAV